MLEHNMSHQGAIEELESRISNHNKELHYYDVQSAMYGIDVPFEIAQKIEQLRGIIRLEREELKKLKDSVSSHS